VAITSLDLQFPNHDEPLHLIIIFNKDVAFVSDRAKHCCAFSCFLDQPLAFTPVNQGCSIILVGSVHQGCSIILVGSANQGCSIILVGPVNQGCSIILVGSVNQGWSIVLVESVNRGYFIILIGLPPSAKISPLIGKAVIIKYGLLPLALLAVPSLVSFWPCLFW